MALDIVTLGMLTLGLTGVDDIVYSKDEEGEQKPSRLGVLGGAGTYAVLGARICNFGISHFRISWLVHRGHDFPSPVQDEIDAWGTAVRFTDTPDRPTTRAKNVYSGELRGFEFVTPKIQVLHTMLDDDQVSAKVFHIIGTPKRCIEAIEGIKARRSYLWSENESTKRKTNALYCREYPTFVWEPMEHSCSPENYSDFRDAMKLVDVFSPNEDEFLKLIGVNTGAGQELQIEGLCDQASNVLADCDVGILVIRLGPRGVLISQSDDDKSVRHTLLPAYYDSASSNVVDVTGGGNAFLGAFCSGFVGQFLSPEHNDLDSVEMAGVLGSIAASFAIEQIGMPKIGVIKNREEQSGYEEGWNGESVKARTLKFLDRNCKVHRWRTKPV
ncbi:uncharacterized protein KY384_008705 [Bacidia gigantensis]|uniref:uncharacterized protein n=1 Tax=Bacidia gigantensis TaxID=2732470 RepID=UPI001D04938C|nr:uncharacterized protein KY384_008705 [Bacidia gigantensis]KAG8526505.1 hypothetical protein KY384_008705 [Bacidia gigantensis]